MAKSQKYDNSKRKGLRRVPSRLTSVVQDIGQWKVKTLYTVIAICLVTLVALYILYRGLETDQVIVNNRSYGYKSNAKHDVMPDHRISGILSMVYDTRPDHCKYTTYSDSHLVPASIILHYNEDEFYSMKLTLQSIVQNTPVNLYSEILLFDDGSTRGPVAKHATEFLKREEFNKVRLVRSESIGGPSASRYKASKIAKSEVLVFVDTRAVVNHGWLEPLVSGVFAYPQSIITSHNDVLREHGVDGKDSKFLPSPDYYLPINTWQLSTVYIEGQEMDKVSYRTIPAMKGDVFVVTKKFLTKIGDYDDQLNIGGGHNMELGLRAWLCGWDDDTTPETQTEEERIAAVAADVLVTPINARLKLSVCSRVAVVDDLKPRKVSSKNNAKRIIDLWYGNYKFFAHVQSETSEFDLNDREKELLVERRLYMKTKNCRSMHWYLTNVAGDTVIPSRDVVQFGQLRGVRTGLTFVCDRRDYITLALSTAYLYDRKRLFELSSNGFLRANGKCMAISGDRRSEFPIIMEPCKENVFGQKWIFSEQGHLRNQDHLDLCLQSVTNRNREQVPMLRKCNAKDAKTLWQFIKF